MERTAYALVSEGPNVADEDSLLCTPRAIVLTSLPNFSVGALLKRS